MNLYEINNQFEEMQNKISQYALENFGEVSDELLAEEKEIFESLDNKVENVGLWIKNKTAFVKALKDEKKSLDHRIKMLSNNIDRNKEYITNFLDGEKFESTRIKISYRKSKSIEIIDQEKLSEDFIKTVTTTSPDKIAIKKAISAGNEVDGAVLVENSNIQIK